jgi:hypothetical protein
MAVGPRRTASLVRAVRTEKGVRQQHICYLGTIEEGKEELPGYRVPFWEKAQRNLDKAGVKGKDRRKIESLLNDVVPRPDRSCRKAYVAFWKSIAPDR